MVRGSQAERSLERIFELWKNRPSRARELRSQGRKVFGYFCCYLPVEILTAANVVPYRITGNLREPVTVGNVYLDPGICPYLGSCFDVAMKGDYDFLDGWVTVDSCNSMFNVFKVWERNKEFPFSYFLDVTVLYDPASIEFFKEELVFFRSAVEEFTQTKVSDESLGRTQFPRDTLYTVGFSDYARELKSEMLHQLSWDEYVYGTNMHHGFIVARRLLSRHKSGNRQIIMVTDGEPTAHLEGSVAYFDYPPHPRTLQLTLLEAKRCAQEGIIINTFMLDRSHYLIQFVDQLTRLNKGRVFYTSSEKLGQYVIVDYLANKRRRISP